MDFVQQLHQNMFNESIEEKMDISEPSTSESQLETIIPPTQSAPIPNNQSEPNVSNFNEEIISKLNKNKIKEIKEKLIKSFVNTNVLNTIKESNINFNLLDSMIKSFKICENNILIIHRKEIFHYIIIGKIIKHVKYMFASNWQNVLKENKIIYSEEYLNFLIRLFNLFEKYKKLYKSSLSLYFFKKNFNIIKEICRKGI